MGRFTFKGKPLVQIIIEAESKEGAELELMSRDIEVKQEDKPYDAIKFYSINTNLETANWKLVKEEIKK